MSAPDRPTREQVSDALEVVDAIMPSGGVAATLAAEVRALRAELDTQNNELTVRRLQDLVAARTSQPAETVRVGDPCPWDEPEGVHEAGSGRDRAECRYCDGTIATAPLPAAPDGEDATCSCCNGDPLTVCAACEQHSCWAGRFMCDESRTAGTKQASPSPNREDDDRPVRWAWAAWLAESAEQADDLDDSERHGLRIAATHLLEDDIAARLSPGDFDPVADPAWALRFTARLWADVETGRAARRVSAPPDGEDVPARLDAAAAAIDEHNRYSCAGGNLRGIAQSLRLSSPEMRAAVAAALARPTERE